MDLPLQPQRQINTVHRVSVIKDARLDRSAGLERPDLHIHQVHAVGEVKLPVRPEGLVLAPPGFFLSHGDSTICVAEVRVVPLGQVGVHHDGVGTRRGDPGREH